MCLPADYLLKTRKMRNNSETVYSIPWIKRRWITAFLIISIMFLVAIDSASAAVPCKPYNLCKKLKHSSATELAGRPHRVMEVIPSSIKNNEFCSPKTSLKAATCKYTYKIILQRPERDSGSGRLPATWSTHSYRLVYEVSSKGWGQLDLGSVMYTVSAVPYPGDRKKVILYLKEGLAPGTHNFRVALNAVYEIGALKLNWAWITDSIRRGWNFVTGRLKYWAVNLFNYIFGSKVSIPSASDAVADLAIKALRHNRNDKADFFQLIVPAKMPHIKGKTKKQADERLHARKLVPNPMPIPTRDSRLHGIIIKHKYRPGKDWLLANTRVDYKYWRYTGNQRQNVQRKMWDCKKWDWIRFHSQADMNNYCRSIGDCVSGPADCNNVPGFE